MKTNKRVCLDSLVWLRPREKAVKLCEANQTVLQLSRHRHLYTPVYLISIVSGHTDASQKRMKDLRMDVQLSIDFLQR